MTATVATLEAHTDEVWDIQWSHDGAFLASASKNKSAIIWRKATQDWSVHLVLHDHIYPVARLAWSPDDRVLLTSSQDIVKMWDVQTGRCIRTLEEHKDAVTSMRWLPDGTGFITSSLDREIVTWGADGQAVDVWDRGPCRITDLAITPDAARLVVVGLEYNPKPDRGLVRVGTAAGAVDSDQISPINFRMIVYRLATKEVESDNPFDGDLTGVQISTDSQSALINKAPNEIYLWDLNAKRLRHRYRGQKQGHHVIRSCFGGPDGSLIISGSEDGNVYIWDRDSETPLEILSGHGNGSVNTVAWNPVHNHIFASCSDDHSIRIWQVSSSDGGQLMVDPQASSRK